MTGAPLVTGITMDAGVSVVAGLGRWLVHNLANKGLARTAGPPTLLVGDIDRGGVFATLFGALALLGPTVQALVAGFIINRFHGDPTVLAPGRDQLRALIGRSTLGGWRPGLQVDAEDSLALDAPLPSMRPQVGRDALDVAVDVAVVRVPRPSNFTAVDAVASEPGVRVTFVDGPANVEHADLVVVPGTKATVSDLARLRDHGLDTAPADRARRGAPVLGVCGACQMLGAAIPCRRTRPDGATGALRTAVARTAHAGVTFTHGRALGVHPSMLNVTVARLDATVAAEARDSTAEPLVGRGSSDPEATAGLQRVARLVWEGRVWPLVEPAFAGLTSPRVPDGLARLGALGARRIVVMPSFLFIGVLADRIAAQAAAIADDHTDTAVHVARWLGPDDRIAALVLDRYDEALTGPVSRHCDTCVHRVAVPGYTDTIGAPLRPHHSDDVGTYARGAGSHP